jgi:sugar/nucleoside kinase (ribokinase family)
MMLKRNGRAADADVALVADMCVDLIVRGNVRPRFHQVEQLVADYELDVGGSGNIFACQIAKLGLRAKVIGRLGEDTFGAHLLRLLAQEGVDTSAIKVEPHLKTGLGVTLVEPDDRAILTFVGSINAATAADLPAHPGRCCTHWHIASYYLLAQLRQAWPEYLRRAKQQGVTTSLDPNWDPEEKWTGVEDLFGLVDVFLPNDAELLAITGEKDMLTAARGVAREGTLVVVKRGENGALAVSKNDVVELARSQIPPIAGIIDSVGAGDNFDAGFLSCWMKGRTLADCLTNGHRCAASSLTRLGGRQGQVIDRQLFQAVGGNREQSA